MQKPKTYLGIIPARYQSTRLPGKPLAQIGDKTMIEHVYRQCAPFFEHLYVATDDERIFNEVSGFHGRVVMTATHHQSGTDRCLEAAEIIAKKQDLNFDVIINIQGDEPFIEGESLELLKRLFDDAKCEFGTLAYRITNEKSLSNPGNVFVTLTKSQKALYFSRSLIPYFRDAKSVDIKQIEVYKHIGLYGYTPDALKKFAAMPQSSLEKAEKLEQNRFLENDGNIYVAVTPHQAIAVDTPQDLENARNICQTSGE